jgi:hypothetical protein
VRSSGSGQVSQRGLLQGKGQTFGTKPEPHAASRAEFGEAVKDRANRAGDGFVGMKQDFTVLFSPDKAHRQSAAQFPASSLIADAAVKTGANDVQLGFAHGTF